MSSIPGSAVPSNMSWGGTAKSQRTAVLGVDGHTLIARRYHRLAGFAQNI
jgi:hypothetical protein